MATFGFIVDTEPGHIFPTLGFIEDILSERHEVHVFGIRDMKKLIKNEKIIFHPIFEDVYPEGFFQHFKQMKKENKELFLDGDKFPRPHIHRIIEGELTEIFDQINFDTIFVPLSLSLEASFLQKLYPDIKLLLITTYLRNIDFTPKKAAEELFDNLNDHDKHQILKQLNVDTIHSLLEPLDNKPEIIFCPKEFGIEKKEYSKTVHHYNCSLRNEVTKSDFFDDLIIPEEKKIIYVSLGSQTSLFQEKALQFFNRLLDFIKSEATTEWFFIVSIGNDIDDKSMVSIPGKMKVVRWAPQLEILERASLMINHGGLGAIKECLHYEVPMLVAPMIYEQPTNAKRIDVHQLGKSLCINEMTNEEIEQQINDIIDSSEVKVGIKKMKAIFSNDESSILDYMN